MIISVGASRQQSPYREIEEFARQRDIPLLAWPTLLGSLSIDKTLITITGSYGKSTVTSLLGQICADAGFDPVCLVRAEMKKWGDEVRVGDGPFWIIEADERYGDLLNFHPRIALITGILILSSPCKQGTLQKVSMTLEKHQPFAP
jgi:UDP-N-acetylmuramate-alanine ligase